MSEEHTMTSRAASDILIALRAALTGPTKVPYKLSDEQRTAMIIAAQLLRCEDAYYVVGENYLTRGEELLRR